MHNIKDNMNCLREFYRDIINSEMRTYRNSVDEAPYIIRFAFLEALIELLDNAEEKDLLQSIYESGMEKISYSEDDITRRFPKFFDSFKTSKKNSAVVADLIKLYPREMGRIGESQLTEMFSDKQQYSRKEIARILSEKMNFIVDDIEIENPDIEE